MKRLIYICVAMLLVVTTGCKKSNPTPEVDNATKLVGEWHCSPEAMDVDIYVEFCDDCSFILYQKVGEGRHRCYRGLWSVEKSTLKGVYADGSEWGSDYDVVFTGDDAMTLTATNGSKEVMYYTREIIPEDVKEGSVDVRSMNDVSAEPIL